MLQVGVVVAQPLPVLPDSEHHIYDKEHVEQQDAGDGDVIETTIGEDKVQRQEHRV